ncbi:MAG: MalM family protein [Aeromonas sp.]
MRRNTKVAVIVAGVLLLGGCASHSSQSIPDSGFATLMASPACCTDFAQMPLDALPDDDSTLEVVLDSSSPVFDFNDGKSYFKAFQLPKQRSQIDITLKSYFTDSIMLPSVLFLDKTLRVVKEVNAEQFQLVYGSIGRRISLDSHITLDQASSGQQAEFMIIKADPKSRQGETKVMSAARKWAKETGLAEPVEADPVFSHSMSGNLALSVRSSGQLLSSGQVMSLGAVQKQSITPSPQPTVGNSKSAIVLPTSTSAPAMLSETEAFYQSQIEKAVKAGDIDKAMKLVNEAERAGSSKAKTVFVDAVKRSQK